MSHSVEAAGTTSQDSSPESRKLSRRRVTGLGVGLGGLALAAPALIGIRSKAWASDFEPEMVFACDGGTTQRVFEEHFFPDFTKMTGTKITYLPGQPADTLAKLRVQKASPAIDVAWLAGGATFQAIDEGLLADFDRSMVPNAQLINPSAGNEKAAIPFGLTVDALTYNSDIFKSRGFPVPTSWWDLWDSRYRGHIGLYSINVTSTIGLIAKISQILSGDYKDVDKTFAKFKELRPNMLDFYASAGAYETAMQQGDCWLGMNTTVRGLEMNNAGLPIQTIIPKEGTVGYQTWLTVVKGAKHPKVATALVNYLLSTDVQQKMVSLIGYAPVNSQATAPANMTNYFPPLKDVLIPDWHYLSGKIPSYVDRWNREIER